MRKKISVILSGLILILAGFLAYRAYVKGTMAPAERVIAILPMGAYNQQYIPQIQRSLEKYYGCKTLVMDPVNIPERFEVHIKKPRYRADSIIQFLREIKPDSVTNVLAYTSQDISCTKYDTTGLVKQPSSKYSDWGIFGLGYRPGPTCVVSDFRLKTNNKKKATERLLKVCLHEIGHNLGLEHCSDTTCFMQDAAESIKTVDQCGKTLCDKCREMVF